MTPHLVWDWNGTLLDDRTLLVESVVSLAREEGIADITAETVTARYARPLRAYFESVLERPLMSSEWAGLERRFHDFYRAGLSGVPLVPDARAALTMGRQCAASQSLVSLWPHAELLQAVAHHGISHLFDQVRGRRTADADKLTELLALLEERQLDPDRTVLIGDTPGDAAAAAAAGMRTVLVTGASLGSLNVAGHDELGVPVVPSVAQAVELACA